MFKNAFLWSTFLSLSGLCLALPVYSDWQTETVIGGKLNTILYVPSTPPVLAGKRALMVSLHGCKQNNELFQQGTQWPSVAEEYGMVVALPDSSGEGTYGAYGCWNFAVGMETSRTSSDAKYLLDLVKALLQDSKLNIDPSQVYITGLSSGGAIVATIACLAPEVFAGAGVSAATPPGSYGKSIGKVDMSVSQGVNNCKTLSNKDGAKAQAWLNSQIHSSICGSLDDRVDPDWCGRLSDIMAAIYAEGANIHDCSGGDNPAKISGEGRVNTFCDAHGPRSSNIMVDGMGHAWSSGPDSSGGGINFDHEHVNYQEYVTEFFFKNNRRVERK